MPEHTIRIEVGGLADPRVEDMDDLYEFLVAYPGLLGPSLSADLVAQTLSLLVTVEAASVGIAFVVVSIALGQALVATERAAALDRVVPVLATAA